MRWKVEDARSSQSDGSLYLEFSRTILWQCYDDEFTILPAGGLADMTYIIGSGADTQSMPATQTYSDCPTTYSCEMYDEASNDWVQVTSTDLVDCTSSTDLTVTIPVCADTDNGLQDANNYVC